VSDDHILTYSDTATHKHTNMSKLSINHTTLQTAPNVLHTVHKFVCYKGKEL